MVNIWSIITHPIDSGCPLCRAPGDGLCPRCHASLPHNDHACARCALPLPAAAPPGTLCRDCQQGPLRVDRVLAPLCYQSPVDDLVSQFKYHRRLALGRVLARLLGDAVEAQSVAHPDLLLPVPMAGRGLRERGFNQAAEIARLLGMRFALPWSATHLQRLHQGRRQRVLDRAARQRNLRHAFRCLAPMPRHVALIDDVVTTGATVDEIARVLQAAGVERIDVWAAARTPRPGG